MDTTVILGTGIIGTAIAYYLSLAQAPSTIHLVEPSTTLFSSASGFAGGFVAADWFAPAAAALGALSFDEHRRLAEAFGGRERWGFAASEGFGYTAGMKGVAGEGGEEWLRDGGSRAASSGARGVGEFCSAEDGPRWLRRLEGDVVRGIGDEGSMAQVYVHVLAWLFSLQGPSCFFLLQVLLQSCAVRLSLCLSTFSILTPCPQ
jgi:glycine/D-amino acid oxidase-like deaminating enzyme